MIVRRCGGSTWQLEKPKPQFVSKVANLMQTLLSICACDSILQHRCPIVLRWRLAHTRPPRVLQPRASQSQDESAAFPRRLRGWLACVVLDGSFHCTKLLVWMALPFDRSRPRGILGRTTRIVTEKNVFPVPSENIPRPPRPSRFSRPSVHVSRIS